MRAALRSTVALTAALLLGATAAGAQKGGGAFKVSSPDIKAGARVPAHNVFNGMGCTGENVSPALQWTGAPRATKSTRNGTRRSTAGAEGFVARSPGRGPVVAPDVQSISLRVRSKSSRIVSSNG